jgi:deazaflavin-dependent oxidoreductase (nitroreductase family)
MIFWAPIPLYRARLGFLFGHRFVMLCHTGRQSGETRRTILEVVVNDPDAVYVAAGWGAKAQWLKNVKADPDVVFYLGSKRFPTRAVIIDVEEASLVMNRYAEAHPRALASLAKFMLDDPGETASRRAERIAASVPMVRLPKDSNA